MRARTPICIVAAHGASPFPVGVPSLLSRLAAAEAKNAYLRNATEQLQVQIESLIRAQEEVRALVSAKLYRWSLALEGR